MDDRGRIASFERTEDAVEAGYRTALSKREARALLAHPKREERPALLAAMRADPNWRPTAHARRVKKNRGALRRASRAVRLARAKAKRAGG